MGFLISALLTSIKMEKLRQTPQWSVQASGGPKTGLESSWSSAHGEEPGILMQTTQVRRLQDKGRTHLAPPPTPLPCASPPLPHVARRVRTPTRRCPVS